MSLLSSVFLLRCPRCRTGRLFPTHTFSFKKSFFMPESCPHCAQKYELEPGFYYGAMFISYIFTALACFIIWSVFFFLLEFDWLGAWGAMVGVVAIFFIYIFRVSRSIWIHINVAYDPKFAKIEED